MEYQWFEELPPSCPPLKLPKFKHANIAVVSLRLWMAKSRKLSKTLIILGGEAKRLILKMQKQ